MTLPSTTYPIQEPEALSSLLISEAQVSTSGACGFLAPLGRLYEATIMEGPKENHQAQRVTNMAQDKMPETLLMVEERSLEHMGAEDEREGRLPLQRLAIPDQFAQVVAGIYRSSYPDVMHLSVFKVIGIKTIVLHIPVVPNKEGSTKTSDQTVNVVMNVLMEKKNHPVIVHCNQGKHRTGTMIACFRKVQAWDHQSIVNEYRSLAGKKARALDEEFIQTYTPPRDILATAKRLGVASWVAVPYPVTSNTADEHPALSRE
ncbi:uncharacterized protein N7458_009861 [Penicillium daleae]|uniref:Tyrosine specific protein phosphatases domain-containing protein n=1 Tax=Penicillium daleae TaxID=63821 RepID=A0AAD6BZ92_9EURO|nr:uncharacterized protein N7458_009861 [Penicillium daleae]KAJ5438863.1 hypothetical protein N7458_009861 [Penicillium daleae]